MRRSSEFISALLRSSVWKALRKFDRTNDVEEVVVLAGTNLQYATQVMGIILQYTKKSSVLVTEDYLELLRRICEEVFVNRELNEYCRDAREFRQYMDSLAKIISIVCSGPREDDEVEDPRVEQAKEFWDLFVPDDVYEAFEKSMANHGP